jgi:hypothetical protein
MNNTIVKDIELDVNSLIIQQNFEYTKIRLPGYEISDEVAAPEVPVRGQNRRFIHLTNHIQKILSNLRARLSMIIIKSANCSFTRFNIYLNQKD